jgi:hypothetical protein
MVAKLPGHKWKVEGSDKSKSAFVYKCNKCGCVTLSGEPLPAPYDKTC